MNEPTTDVLESVRARYASGATRRIPELCCPVDYDASLLAALPPEILERDYGCGDPSRFARPGEVVLDLGSGAGKICYLASQLVGAEGRVIGVDATDEMLELARRFRQEIGDRIGWHNVEFRRGEIQDLALDHDALAAWVAAHPVTDLAGVEALRREEERLRREAPMIADESVDLVLSNCVLNLVDDREKERMFREIRRVLRRGGRAAISDIVCDEDVPAALRADPDLWTGCISGAMREDRFVQAFADAGLHGVEIVAYQAEPWAVVQGIEFRSMTVVAHKQEERESRDHGEVVVYKGPFRSVVDDDGHVYRRGERTAVCRNTYDVLRREPYADAFLGVVREDHAPGAEPDAGAACCEPGTCC